MTVRVSLVAPAGCAALREARFGDGSGPDGSGGGGLDAGGLRRARAAAGRAPRGALVLASPSARCRETAAALGLRAAPEDALRGCDPGRWRGLRLDEVAAAEPAAVAAWLADPAAAPHGGESLLGLLARVGAWLDGLAEGGPARVVAVAEPDVVRAAAVHALGAPPRTFWRLDVAPLTATALSGRAGRWNLRPGAPLAPAVLPVGEDGGEAAR
ncbi:histidine phosphatase family protein [Streptomyces sp. NPDC001380]|uniref:histidine phosphatase family protein n=1 Tax=Streptomyces sp. NPDC001380 TaxID=3364566 RepID=UPI003692D83F